MPLGFKRGKASKDVVDALGIANDKTLDIGFVSKPIWIWVYDGPPKFLASIGYGSKCLGLC